MANRATIAFVFAIIGAAYQMLSLYVAALVDRNTYLYNYGYVYETLFFSSFFVFWSASHLIEDWRGRITWPSITPILAIIPGPLLMIFGGILGFSAVRQYSREQGRAVLGHA